jgi:cyclophilin family peptidyl-prolyl cis-trans isomerase
VRSRGYRFSLSAAALMASAVMSTRGAEAQDPPDLIPLLVAENRRGTGPERIEPLIRGAGSGAASVRRVAALALGRLQRPDLLPQIAKLLADSDVTVRVEAANAVGQAAQGARVDSARQGAVVAEALRILADRQDNETNSRVLGAIARTIGRLPYRDSSSARAGERRILASVMKTRSAPSGPDQAASGVTNGAAHGLYSLARVRRALGSLSDSAVTWLATLVMAQPSADSVLARRLALLALAANGTARADVAERAARDPDPQLRRTNVAYVGAARVPNGRNIVTVALRDDTAMVRLEAIRVWRQLFAATDCAPLVSALGDQAAHVALAAIDALGGACPDSAATTSALRDVAEARFAFANPRLRSEGAFHARAHALVSLARLAPQTARPLLQAAATAREWQTRMYVARGAAIARDSATLTRLANDSDGNVREAAIEGLAATAGHVADPIYASALASPHYHVVLAAATALRGARLGDSVVSPLLDALERITRERRETSRDPRIAILERVEELGSARHAARLEPLRQDFDTTVAARAAAVLSRWTGRGVAAAPRPLEIDTADVVHGAALRRAAPVLRVHMASRGPARILDIRLDAVSAPATVGRLMRLAREGHYDGKTFHRVASNFVVQGGSPAASEYVGDGPFMRDELSLANHVRYSLGISTRGRDTGDAQIFVNLIDNFRLDHDYTVFGWLTRGGDVVDEMLEGDVIERIEVIEGR